MIYPEIITGLIKHKKQTFTIPDAYDFFRYLELNRLLYWFALGFRNHVYGSSHTFLDEVTLKGRSIIENRLKTKSVISDILNKSKIEYAFVKEYEDWPYINSDIDLLVREADFDYWIALLIKNSFQVKKHREFLKERGRQRTVLKDNLYKIDLTAGFGWQNSEYFSPDFLWSHYNPGNHRLSEDADLAINIATIIFKRMHVGYLDYLYLQKKLKSKKRYKLLLSQSDVYGWSNSFQEFICFIRNINPERDTFPVLFTPRIYLTIFKEKFIHKQISGNYWLYSTFSVLRYKLNAYHLPYHVWWFNRNRLDELKGCQLKIKL